MNRLFWTALLVLECGGIGRAAQCTTVLDLRILGDYNSYVRTAEAAMAGRFEAGELTWVPPASLGEARERIAAGKIVRWNLSDRSTNQSLAARNGTVIHWIGAVRIRGRSLSELQSVLEDYDHWERFYRPVVFSSRTEPMEMLSLGLHSTFRFASVLPQHYSFRVQARVERSGPPLRIHLAATEIRESDSGVPGRNDLLEPGRDHGIMWALNAYWRARRLGNDLYLEFETITLARSVQTFACKIGFIPVPKSALWSAMESIPAESVKVILEGTKAECERRAVS